MKYFAFLFILTMFINSCASLSNQSSQQQDQKILDDDNNDTSENIVDFSMPLLEDEEGIIYPYFKNKLLVECESNLDRVFKILGDPKDIKVEKFTNVYVESQTDELHHLFFDGIDLTAYIIRNSEIVEDSDILINITLTGEQYKLPGNIRIGSSLETVKQHLKPLLSVDNYYVYQNVFEGGFEEEIHLFFSDTNRLSKVVWYCIN
jgi:hypothetical protein